MELLGLEKHMLASETVGIQVCEELDSSVDHVAIKEYISEQHQLARCHFLPARTPMHMTDLAGDKGRCHIQVSRLYPCKVRGLFSRGPAASAAAAAAAAAAQERLLFHALIQLSSECKGNINMCKSVQRELPDLRGSLEAFLALHHFQ